MTYTSIQALDQFSKLIHPIEPDEFFEKYYEQRPLYIERRDTHYFDDLLTAGEIERLFQSAAIAKSLVRMTKEGKEAHSDQFSERADGVSIDRLSNDKVLQLFEEGNTLIINSGHHLFPDLDRFCTRLEGELRFRVQPNIYITPFSAQGFDTHYDEHDVFVMQIMGAKNWQVYHSAVELPSARQRWKKGVYTVGDPELNVTLSPGDMLYLPRGVMHDARTDGTTSAHITLGFHPTRRFDLVQELSYLAEDLPAFRKSVPLGLLRDRAAAAAAFRSALKDLVDTVDVEALMERRHKAFVESRRLDSRGRFRDLARLNQLNLNTVVRRRPTFLYLVERSEASLTVSFAGKKIPVQPFLESALESILGDEAFAVRDIKGFLSDTARLDLVRRFLSTGFLEIVELNGAG